jgi:hypothetical protein
MDFSDMAKYVFSFSSMVNQKLQFPEEVGNVTIKII